MLSIDDNDKIPKSDKIEVSGHRSMIYRVRYSTVQEVNLGLDEQCSEYREWCFPVCPLVSFALYGYWKSFQLDMVMKVFSVRQYHARNGSLKMAGLFLGSDVPPQRRVIPVQVSEATYHNVQPQLYGTFPGV